jgi:hypothetical protein
MNRIKLKHVLLVAGALVGFSGCSDTDLAVENPNSADSKRVLATPTDVENLLGSYYRRYMSGLYTGTGNVWGMAAVQTFEDYSTLSNNCMGQRIPIPRPANDNTLGNPCGPEQAAVYNRESEVEHVASQILAQIEGGSTVPAASVVTLGSPAQNARAIAFGQFLRGMSLGYLSIVYDSAAIITPEQMAANPADGGSLDGYDKVFLQSMDAFDKAIAAAATGSTAFPLPANWIQTPAPLDAAGFTRLIRTYKAYFRASVGRTPTERAAADWAAIVADAQAGITSDFINITSTTSGPRNDWVNQFYSYGTWHQMTPFVIGMGDISGTYNAWIQQPLATRGGGSPFFMVTPDLRFPQGASRTAQQTDFQTASCNANATPCKRYFVNRTSDNAAANSWGASNYDHARWTSWKNKGDAGSGQNGAFPFFTVAELNLIEAEGHIRLNNGVAAAALINKTRVANGLAPVTAVITAPVPVQTAFGFTDCVPRVPLPAPQQGSGSPGTKCGDMFEALKWEKRIETAYTHFAPWFFDMRGWGDLPQGTGLHWAVPYQDLQVRLRPNYSAGGGLPGSSAPLGTYGW